MRCLNRNKQTFYYALYKGEVEEQDTDGNYTGEREIEYYTPVKMKANISAARGESDLNPFGIETNYNKTIVTDDMKCPIKEDTVIWIGKDPTEDPYNYIVVKKAASLNTIVYAIREVQVGIKVEPEPEPEPTPTPDPNPEPEDEDDGE